VAIVWADANSLFFRLLGEHTFSLRWLDPFHHSLSLLQSHLNAPLLGARVHELHQTSVVHLVVRSGADLLDEFLVGARELSQKMAPST
jgi:hypothetical protein